MAMDVIKALAVKELIAGIIEVGSSTTSHALGSDGDLFVSNDFEVNGDCFLDKGFKVLDGKGCFLGSANDAGFTWNTAETNDALIIFTECNAVAQSGNIIITHSDNRGKSHDHAITAYPKLIIHSSENPDTNNTEWMSFAHNGTTGIIKSGLGGITISQTLAAASALVISVDNAANTGASINSWSLGTGYAIVTSDGSANGSVKFAEGDASTSKQMMYVKRNYAAASTSAPVAEIINDNSSDDQPVLRLQQDVATVEVIDFSAGSIAFDFAAAMVSTAGNTMAINNSPGTGATTWVKVEVNGTAGYIPVHYA